MMDDIKTRKTRLLTTTNSMGKLTPQAIDVEEAVLGALMLEKEAFVEIQGILKPESFYSEAHQKIYQAISNLYNRADAVDIITVTQELRKDGNLELVGGPYYITNLTNRVASSANIETHARIITEKSLQRELIKLCDFYRNECYNDTSDVFDLLDNISSDLSQKVNLNVGQQAQSIDAIIFERMTYYSHALESGLTGMPTGFRSIDSITNGWQKSNLIILAARPGMGKTAFALNLARHASIIGKSPVAIFSLEMSKEQLVERMMAAESETQLNRFNNRDLKEYDYQRLHTAIVRLGTDIFIDDSHSISIQALRSKAIRLKNKHKIGMIVVDYLQLMKDPTIKNNREQEISSISRGLKGIAKELNIPVIALSQLSRAVDSRPGLQGKRPLLSDLRESGSIEQDADQVIFLYRPEYYGITEDEEGRSLAGMTEVIFQKNRNGALDTVPMRFSGKFMKFFDLEDDYFQDNSAINSVQDSIKGVF